MIFTTWCDHDQEQKLFEIEKNLRNLGIIYCTFNSIFLKYCTGRNEESRVIMSFPNYLFDVDIYIKVVNVLTMIGITTI